MTKEANPLFEDDIMDSLNEGLYVCDNDRRIQYWSKSAERITGWTSQDVVGHRCLDNILVHVDKDGRHLCGEEFCPLHRSMRTNKRSRSPIIVFGKTSTGGRIPMSVSVAPILDAKGLVVGGVETFSDYTETYTNLKRARRIQTLSMEHDLPKDDRLSFHPFYIPHDMIGGDYFAFRQLDADQYGFILADVMGHGVAAALYTMHLSALCERYMNNLPNPKEFAHLINLELCKIVKDESFATAVCGVIDASRKRVRFTSAGGPPLILFKSSHCIELIEAPGWPLGMDNEAEYDEKEFQFDSGDSLLLFSDGATDIMDAAGNILGAEGLIKIMRSMGYPETGIKIESLQNALLTSSNDIRLDDDLTLLEVRFF